MYQYKDPFMDFITGLLVLTNWKDETHDSILVIVDKLRKLVHYKMVKLIINIPSFIVILIDT